MNTYSTAEPQVYEFKLDKGQGYLALFGALMTGGIGLWAFHADSAYCLPMFGLSFLGAVSGLYFLLDNSVRLRLDESGITSHRSLGQVQVSWNAIDSYRYIEVTRGASIRDFLKFRLMDGKEIQIEISRLNYPASQIHEIVQYYLG